MKRILILFIIIASWLSASLYADGVDNLKLSDAEIKKLKKYFPDEENEQATWNGNPIIIELPIGKEKRIVFPSHVTVDVKGVLTTEQLRLLNNDKSLYLTALIPFRAARIYVTVTESGKVILIDLSTSHDANNHPHYINIQEKSVTSHQKQFVNTKIIHEADDINKGEITKLSDNDSYVDLIRFAWKEAYAPRRLLKQTNHFSRVAMHTERFISYLIYGDKVIAHPVASWRSKNHYVTVVYLQNKYPHGTRIDIRKDLCGIWLAATIYPRSTLKPHGDKEGDSTALF